jgi:surfactin synthase thioesterase subunit
MGCLLYFQAYEVIQILEEHKVSMVKQMMGSRQRPYHHHHHHHHHHQAAAGEVYSV